MTRKIIDFKKLSKELKELLVLSYPTGIYNNGFITFKNKDGETIEAIELRTKEAVYLIKINKYSKLELDDVYANVYDWFDHDEYSDEQLYDDTDLERTDFLESELETL